MSGQQSTTPAKAAASKAGVSPVPKGYHTVTPYLMVEGGAKFIEFLTRAFDAKSQSKMQAPDGRIGHAEILLGDSHLMLSDAMGEQKALPTMLYLYLADADASYRRAIAAGATGVKEPADQFYGDRAGCVTFAGVTIWIATHIEDVPTAELERRAQDAMKQMGQQKH